MSSHDRHDDSVSRTPLVGVSSLRRITEAEYNAVSAATPMPLAKIVAASAMAQPKCRIDTGENTLEKLLSDAENNHYSYARTPEQAALQLAETLTTDELRKHKDTHGVLKVLVLSLTAGTVKTVSLGIETRYTPVLLAENPKT